MTNNNDKNKTEYIVPVRNDPPIKVIFEDWDDYELTDDGMIFKMRKSKCKFMK